jgi:hypothetical protein
VDASVVSEPTVSPDETSTSNGPAKLISLAPQGGGAHSGFTRGFLDRRPRTIASGLTGSARRGVGATKVTV